MFGDTMFGEGELRVLANGIAEGGKVRPAIEWIERMLRETHNGAMSPTTAFEYTNRDGMTHQLFVDLTGVMDTSYEAGFPQVVFQTVDDLVGLWFTLVTEH